MKSKFLIIILSLGVLSACNNFLDEVQDNRTLIDSEEKVAKLLVYAYPNAQFATFAESMSDNAGDKNSEGAIGPQATINESAFLWEDIESITQLDAPANFWNACYEAIAQANQALASLESLPRKTSRASALRGEALLARAYAHFMLVNFFSMRYDPATAATQLGIVYMVAPEQNAIVRHTRQSVAEVYRLIEQDLSEGLTLVGSDYEEPKFHFTPRSAHAFATRFYLYKGEWQKVIESANVVLGNQSPANVIRDVVSVAFNSLTYSQRTIQYSSVAERSNLLVAWTNSLVGRNFARYRYALSAAKLEGIFSDRTTNPFRKAWGYGVYGTDIFFNIPKYTEYFRITNISAGTGSANASVVHFTTDEVLLNRAEAYAMLDNFEAASNDLTAFLSQKLNAFNVATDQVTLALMKTTYPVVANEYTPYYSLSDDQASLVKGIAEFRRREFYHEGIRWLDIKRFNLVVTHQFSSGGSVTLPKDDLRRAIQIPEATKAFGLEPNAR